MNLSLVASRDRNESFLALSREKNKLPEPKHGGDKASSSANHTLVATEPQFLRLHEEDSDASTDEECLRKPSLCETSDICSCATCKTLQTLAHRLVLRILFIQQNDTESRKRTTRYVMTSCGWTVCLASGNRLTSNCRWRSCKWSLVHWDVKMQRKQESMHAMGETLTGRAALWSSHQRFKTERGVPSQVEKSKLTSLKLECDHELYLDSLDAVLVIFRKVPDDVLLLALVEAPLRKVKQFAHEFVFNDRAGLESTEKSFACP